MHKKPRISTIQVKLTREKTYVLIRREEQTTETELKAIAADPIHGCKKYSIVRNHRSIIL